MKLTNDSARPWYGWTLASIASSILIIIFNICIYILAIENSEPRTRYSLISCSIILTFLFVFYIIALYRNNWQIIYQ